MSRYTIERYDSREAWLDGTHGSIGASGAAGPLGLSSWSSPYSAWVRLTEPRESSEMDEIQRWGLLLEPVILAEFCERSGVKAEQLPPITVHRDGERSHLHATLDAMAEDGSPVELKTAHFASGKIWGTEVPPAYLVQCQMQIHVTGAKQAYIAVLVDGFNFAWHKVPRHQRFIDRMLKRLDHFWAEHVVKRVPPPVDYSQATRDALARKYPTDNGAVVDLPVELEEKAQRMGRYAALKKKLERRIDLINNEIRAEIGEASYARTMEGGFSWKANKNGTRTLRRVKRIAE